jgi:SAM-dependent methyltransferase
MTSETPNSSNNYHAEPLPQSEEEIRARHESNRAGWNEGAARYTQEVEETISFLRAGGSNLHPIERANLGNLREWCKTAIHLQCASGRDTLSLLHEGVEHVIGIDISDVHIENARRTSTALNAPARWYRCDVLDTPVELNETADMLYTGRGALCWLQDLSGWGKVVARLLKPGGIFHILDDHPITWLFDTQASDLRYSGVTYFNYAESGVGWPASYIGDLAIPIEKQSRKFERLWSLADVFTALKAAGLEIMHLGEHAQPYWNIFPYLKPEMHGRIPLTFSLMARKPKL